MKYSVTTFKKLCRLAAGEQKFILQKKEYIESMNLFGIGSTSVVQIYDKKDPTRNTVESKLFLLEDLEREVNAYKKIYDCVLESAMQIDPVYRKFVIGIYLVSDDRSDRKSPSRIAEDFGFDRRKFVPDLDNAIKQALAEEEVTAKIDMIKKIALEYQREEYLKIFEEAEEDSGKDDEEFVFHSKE